MKRKTALTVLASGGIALMLSVHAVAATPTPLPDPTPTATPAPTAEPTSAVIQIQPPGQNGPLPPTATPAIAATPRPTPTPTPLPSGAAPQITNPTPTSIGGVSTLPLGQAPSDTKNPLGTFVLTAFLVCLGLAGLSTWLFFRLRR